MQKGYLYPAMPKIRRGHMRCSRCHKQSVITLPYMSQSLCEEHFMRIYEKRIKRRVMNGKMFGKSDSIMVKGECLGANILKHYLKKKHYNVVGKNADATVDSDHLECYLAKLLVAFFNGKKARVGLCPLAECPRDENILYARLEGIKMPKKRACHKNRMEEYILNMLDGMEKEYPGSKFKLLASFEKLS